MRVEITPASAPRWPEAAAFIASTFAQSFGARIVVEPLPLAVVTGCDGRIIAAAGMRTCEDGFFSQVYLDLDIPDALSRLGRGPVLAEEIIEVVSLASTRPAATLPLIEAITDEGRRHGKTWGLFTATRRLADMLARTGSPVERLVAAQPGRIADPARWGSYYQTDPWVCAMPDRKAVPLRFLPAGRSRSAGVQPCI